MDPLRNHLLALLKGGLAFDTFDSIIAEFKPEDRGAIPGGAEHSAWQILEHLRICLQDILDFSQNEDGRYREMDWPAEYWPASPLPNEKAWDETLRLYRDGLDEVVALINDQSRDLFAPFPWGEGQTLLREILLVTDHAAYHLGQLTELKRWLDADRRA